MTQNNRERLRHAQAAQVKQQRLTRIIGVGAAVLVVVVIGVMVGVLFANRGSGSAAALTPPNATADGKAIVVNPGKATQGAPVVELFFDYQCPVCKQFEDAFGDALSAAADAGDIELRYRTMTFLDSNLKNDASVRAGVAASCADVSGRYTDFHETIYTNQPTTEGDGYSDAVLRDEIPAAIGLAGEELTAFQACYDQQSTKAFVTGSNVKGTQDMLAVNQRVATPTVHVDGKDLPLNDIAGVDPSGLLDLIRSRA